MSFAITTDVGGLEGVVGIDIIVSAVDVFGTFDVVEVPILGNAIGDVAIPDVGIGNVTVLLVDEIALPGVAYKANGVETLEIFSMFPDPFDASAAVTFVEIMRSSCSGVVGISTLASCLLTLVEDAVDEDDVASDDPASGPLFRFLLGRIDDSFSIV